MPADRIPLNHGELYRARQLAGLSRRDVLYRLANEENLRLDLSTLGRYETGRRAPSPRILAALGRVLDVKPAELYAEKVTLDDN